MGNTVQKIECPSCGGRMLYDITRRRVVCQFCGCIRTDDGSFAVAADHTVSGIVKGTALYAYDGVQEAAMPEAKPAAQKKVSAGTLREASCGGCGAKLVFREGVQTACPFCGSVYVDVMDFSAEVPAGIIPFKVDAAGVETALRFPIGNNILVPKAFKPLVSADQYRAVYLPCWVVSAEVSVHFDAVYGDKPTWMHKKTEGQFTKKYTNIPLAASDKFAQALEEQLGEYNLAGNAPFEPELLAGVPAECCSLSLDEAWPMIEEKLRQTAAGDIADMVMQKTGAASCKATRIDMRCENKTYKYILVPLWVNTVTFKGQTFHTSINGENAIYGGGYPTIYGKVGRPTYFK